MITPLHGMPKGWNVYFFSHEPDEVLLTTMAQIPLQMPRSPIGKLDGFTTSNSRMKILYFGITAACLQSSLMNQQMTVAHESLHVLFQLHRKTIEPVQITVKAEEARVRQFESIYHQAYRLYLTAQDD